MSIESSPANPAPPLAEATPGSTQAAPAKPRVQWVDYAKGISIFLVVVYHVFNGLAKRRDEVAVPLVWDRLINPAFEMVRMPLFFFVSGLFIGKSAQKPLKTFLTDRAASTLWPYVIWSVLQTIVLAALARATRKPPEVPLGQLPYRLAFAPVYQFWFLYVLFMALTLYVLLVKLRLRPWMILGVGVVLIGVKLNVNFGFASFETARYRIGLPYWGAMFQLFNFFIYLALGAVLAPVLLKNVDRWPSWPLAVAAPACAAVVAAAVLSKANLHRDSAAPFARLWWPVGFPVALASVASALSAAVLLQRSGVATAIRTMGQFSLYIFVLHVMAAAAVRAGLLKAHVASLPVHVVLGVAAGVLVPMAVAVVARKRHATALFTLRPG